MFQAITKGDERMIDRSYYVELFEDANGSRDNHICSGIIIFDRWIVTSGECVPSNTSTQPWAFVGFRRYRGGGTSATWVMQTKAAHHFNNNNNNNNVSSCKKNPLMIYEMPRDVPGVTTINMTANATESASRPFTIGVSRASNTSETLNLNFASDTAVCGCVNDDLCVSEANATGHLDEHDSGAALLIDGNLVGVNSHRVNANLLVFTKVYNFKDWIAHVVGKFV